MGENGQNRVVSLDPRSGSIVLAFQKNKSIQSLPEAEVNEIEGVRLALASTRIDHVDAPTRIGLGEGEGEEGGQMTDVVVVRQEVSIFFKFETQTKNTDGVSQSSRRVRHVCGSFVTCLRDLYDIKHTNSCALHWGNNGDASSRSSSAVRRWRRICRAEVDKLRREITGRS